MPRKSKKQLEEEAAAAAAAEISAETAAETTAEPAAENAAEAAADPDAENVAEAAADPAAETAAETDVSGQQAEGGSEAGDVLPEEIGGITTGYEWIDDMLRPLKGVLPENILRTMHDDAIDFDVTDDELEKVIEATKTRYENSCIEPCDAAGVVAGQSLGEPGTQMTMRTFHYAGVSEMNVTLGLPRLIEIVDARKLPSTPTMTIALTNRKRIEDTDNPEDVDVAFNRDKAQDVATEIEATNITQVAEVTTDLSNMNLVIDLKPSAMDKKKLDFETISSKLRDELPKETEMTLREEINQIEIAPATKDLSYRSLLQLDKELKKIVIKGIPSIKRVVVRKEDDKDPSSEYALYTEGTALKEVLEIEGVDPTRTTTNNILEIYEVFGIEAARNAIIREISNTLREQGLDVDIRHIMLVADLMTSDGEVKQIGRHGISGEKASVFARAAFEVTVNHLLDAGMRGNVDELRGVTENVIVGQPIKMGTGDIRLIAKKKNE